MTRVTYRFIHKMFQLNETEAMVSKLQKVALNPFLFTDPFDEKLTKRLEFALILDGIWTPLCDCKMLPC